MALPNQTLTPSPMVLPPTPTLTSVEVSDSESRTFILTLSFELVDSAREDALAKARTAVLNDH